MQMEVACGSGSRASSRRGRRSGSRGGARHGRRGRGVSALVRRQARLVARPGLDASTGAAGAGATAPRAARSRDASGRSKEGESHGGVEGKGGYRKEMADRHRRAGAERNDDREEGADAAGGGEGSQKMALPRRGVVSQQIAHQRGRYCCC